MRFPNVRVALAINTILCMVTALLLIIFVLVLYRTLQETNQVLSLIGSVLSVAGYMGIALLDAFTFYAFAPLSDIYHAPVATLEAQATVVLLCQAIQGIPHTFVYIVSLFLMIGFVILGLVMKKTPVYCRRLGWMSILIGFVGVVSVVFSLLVFETIGMIFLANFIFLLLIGRKVYSLSREPNSPIS